MVDMAQYRSSPTEIARISDLMSLLPDGEQSVLEIGARDGYISALLAKRFPRPVALDLAPLHFDFTGLLPVQADVVALPFPDDTFDAVLCAEVLEHIPDLERACSELVRVSQRLVVVGVPYRQDTRVERTTCQHCGRHNPAWGHINGQFDERKLRRLFPDAEAMITRYVGTCRERTNEISRWLMDRAGNPWGTYDQDESCVFCGHVLTPPKERRGWQRICSKLAAALDGIERVFVKPHAYWMHIAFEKRQQTMDGGHRQDTGCMESAAGAGRVCGSR